MPSILVRQGQELEKGGYKSRAAGVPEAGRAKDIAQGLRENDPAGNLPSVSQVLRQRKCFKTVLNGTIMVLNQNSLSIGVSPGRWSNKL